MQAGRRSSRLPACQLATSCSWSSKPRSSLGALNQSGAFTAARAQAKHCDTTTRHDDGPAIVRTPDGERHRRVRGARCDRRARRWLDRRTLRRRRRRGGHPRRTKCHKLSFWILTSANAEAGASVQRYSSHRDPPCDGQYGLVAKGVRRRVRHYREILKGDGDEGRRPRGPTRSRPSP